MARKSSARAKPSKPIERCIVHFGFAKTGTSAIQATFSRNKAALLKNHGILYPGTEPQHWHLQSIAADNPHKLVQIQRAGLGEADVQPFLARFREDLSAEIRSSGARTLVVSSEYLAALDGHELERLRAFLTTFTDDIEAVFFIRDPWSFAASYAQELIRNGYVAGVEVEPGYVGGETEIIDRVCAGFTKKLTFFPYLGRGETDSVAVFLGHLGVDPSRIERVSVDEENQSISHQAACLLLFFNTLKPQFDRDGKLIHDPARDWCVEAITQSVSRTDPVIISRRRAERILRRARANLERMHREYFNGSPVFFDHFERTRFLGIDDKIAIDGLETKEASTVLMRALHLMAQRAQQYHAWAMHAEEQLKALHACSPAMPPTSDET